jgi:small subunit ribosomal protein S20
MPNKKSAEKELRKSISRAIKNNEVKDKIHLLTKKTKKAIASGEETAKDFLKQTMTALDKAAKTGLIKKNTRDRKKSRLHKKLNAMSKAIKK